MLQVVIQAETGEVLGAGKGERVPPRSGDKDEWRSGSPDPRHEAQNL